MTVLLAAAGIVFALPRAGRHSGWVHGAGTGMIRAAGSTQRSRRYLDDVAGRSAAHRSVDLHELPLFVHQLAGLLRAGRPPHVLWEDMERVHADGRTAFAGTVLPLTRYAKWPGGGCRIRSGFGRCAR